MNKTRFLFLLSTPVAVTATSAASNPERPNVIFILCDDMGYGDLGCYGQPYIQTPNIDSLSRSGIRFTQAYAGSPVSAPSRASLMTGQHSGHCEVRGNKEYWRDVPMMKYGDNDEFTVVGQHPYDPNHIILPELFKDRGYDTGMFGKWAGGYEGSCSTPDKRGVDEYFGFLCQFQAHLYYPNFLNRYSKSLGDTATVRVTMEENIKYPMTGPDYLKRPEYSADIIHEKALEWLDNRDADTPFFGLFTYTLPHAELVQPRDSILQHYTELFTDDHDWGGQPWSRYNATTHTHAQFAGMITRLDAYVGDIMRKLDEKGLADNTILIFTSDNGPHEEGGADPTFFGRDGKLRGLKREIHEGGIRVPFILRWPAKVAGGKTVDTPIIFYDMMPTFAELTGVSDFPGKYANPDKRVDYFDGISIVPVITGEGTFKGHDFLYWEFDETDQMGLRIGPWKLIVKKGEPQLYNLDNDIHEDHDIASEHPELVNAMVRLLLTQHTHSPHFSVTLPTPR